MKQAKRIRPSTVALAATTLVSVVDVVAVASSLPQSGLLTAADVDDGLNFADFLSYQRRALRSFDQGQQQHDHHRDPFDEPWEPRPPPLPDVRLWDRIPILVVDDSGRPYSNAIVELRAEDETTVVAEVQAGTDGRATLFPSIDAEGAYGPHVAAVAEEREAPEDLSRGAAFRIAARPPGGTCPEDCGAVVSVAAVGTAAGASEDLDAISLAGRYVGADAVEVGVPGTSVLPRKLDLALVLDTTGSMCDEIEYLRSELRGVIRNVVENAQHRAPVQDLSTHDADLDLVACTEEAKQCPDGSFVGRDGPDCAFAPCPGGRRLRRPDDSRRSLQDPVDVRVGVVAYRDVGDAYVTKRSPFSDPDAAVDFLAAAGCEGGGDYPEAMHLALASASSDLDWRAGNVARVAFLVADAPPHPEDYDATLKAALDLRRRGVRVYAVAASGVADEAEYAMRLVSLVTGARYAWLTDDSRIGLSHAEPKVRCYRVTRLDSLLTRLLASELAGERFEAREEEIVREVGGQEKGVCIVDFQPDETSPPTKAPTGPEAVHLEGDSEASDEYPAAPPPAPAAAPEEGAGDALEDSAGKEIAMDHSGEADESTTDEATTEGDDGKYGPMESAGDEVASSAVVLFPNLTGACLMMAGLTLFVTSVL